MLTTTEQQLVVGAESNLFECMEGKDFNPVDWVNQLVVAAAASSLPTSDETDDALLNAVRSAQTRLQTRSQELSRDAERLMERLLSLGPRALQELDRVERDAQALKQDLKRLQDESRASTAGGIGPFQTLKSLDIIKTNLERCVQVLQETGSWNVLVREMESYFASRNLGEVASRLNIMKQSAAALAVFPGSDERQEMLERMEQRLESLVRPGLANALEQADTDRDLLKQSVVVFTKLGRGEALLHDLAASRGRLLFTECWNTKDESFAKFTDRVFARLRQVELPLCEYVFAGVAGGGVDGTNNDLQIVSNALGAILQSCFDLVTPQLVSTLTNKQCERYVMAHLAAEQFALDVTNSLLRPASPQVQSAVSQAILYPFRELDAKYLEWEAAELTQTLQTEVAKLATGGSTSALGPSVRDRLQLEMNPRDALDMLSEACLSRCHRIKLSRAFLPICKMYYSHLTTAKVFQSSSKATTVGKLEPRDRLHTLCQLKQRFETCITERCGVAIMQGKVEEDIAKVQRKLDQLIQEAKSLLFDLFLDPALALLDLAVLGEADSVTKIVDHLYALIPQLEFEYCTRDFLADPAVLGRRERQDLETVLGKRAIPYSTAANNVNTTGGEEEDIPRQVSASWLECIARAMCTGLVLRVVKLKSISDPLAAKLGADTDMLEKNAGSVLSPGDKWDPALGVCRVVLSAEPGLTYLKLGDPKEHLDSRYLAEGEEHADDALKALEHLLVGLRTRRVE
ncbi:hypothetical protein BASA81_005478 [Batrachochytrium salamandrivorans]|nr:hypothetical protein BASA81_005478 [Batrachochytrium salamandrivorans]